MRFHDEMLFGSDENAETHTSVVTFPSDSTRVRARRRVGAVALAMGTSGEVPSSATSPQHRRRFLLEARDLEPSWERTLIALLLGLDLFEDAADANDVVDTGSVPDVPPPPAGHARVWKLKDSKSAAVECASMRDFLGALLVDGLEVPCTHGYKHRRVTPLGNARAETFPLHTLSPSLETQLAPLPTPELERRLAAASCDTRTLTEDDARDAKRAKIGGDAGPKTSLFPAKREPPRCKITRHLRLCRQLASSMNGERPTRSIDGRRLDVQGESHHASRLLTALRAFDGWPEDSKKRKGVGAAAYAILKRKDVDKMIALENHAGTSEHGSHLKKVVELWRLAQATLNVACRSTTGDEPPAFDAVALTRGFRGSPHVDARDTSHQYVLALGDFPLSEGALCVEEVAEEVAEVARPGDARDTGDAGDGDSGGDRAARGRRDGEKKDAAAKRFVPTGRVLRVNVKNRVARIDGRNVHWVEGWSGERFSVVFFCTKKENATEMQATATHEDWMVAKQKKIFQATDDNEFVAERRVRQTEN